MSSSITLLAAGSLRLAFTPLLNQFTRLSGIEVNVGYGPAGLLRERIEAGEPCALFASANRAHPQRLLDTRQAVSTHTLCWNQLGLVTNRRGEWLDLLRDPVLRIGTSTPGCDPSGDYTWAFFDNMDAREPGLGQQLRARALPLVGGRDTLSIPPGELASSWLLRQGLADLFIGYAHYAKALGSQSDVRYVAIPAEQNILCEYQLAVLDASEEVMRLVKFMLAHDGQAFLTAAGFLPVSAGSQTAVQ
ncbi:substrate-binding domain-containing protein [Citrobacter sp. RHBSTW-00671]|uniref:substrate-binding domain-containing protein n=1 Tax=Citrobacter sp. RHBSTW-00671 TaxID=2742660 RepID=UPI0017B9D58B|nr:substrate-binding domain-containing protein [Citrobacter sp. RHBSTW-00671]MBA7967685.1 substrate-binding domain-containing protein [Citrobacter sp. RHBSTW-00671]HCJ6372489.1 substrate-binding domain-containing protein [Citrobacter freundii]